MNDVTEGEVYSSSYLGCTQALTIGVCQVFGVSLFFFKLLVCLLFSTPPGDS